MISSVLLFLWAIFSFVKCNIFGAVALVGSLFVTCDKFSAVVIVGFLFV